MLNLILYEIKKHSKAMIIENAVIMALLTITPVVYKLNKTILFKLSGFILSLPKEIRELLGINTRTQTDNLIFYILYVLMLINIALIWISCSRVFKLIYDDEKSGRILSLCNQVYSKGELCIGKYLSALFTFYIQHIIIYLYAIMFIWLFSFNYQQQLSEVKKLLILMSISLIVITLYISATFVFSVVRNSLVPSYIWLCLIIFLPIVLGYIFKIGIAFSTLFNKFGTTAIVIVMITCIFISAGCFFCAYNSYKNREFYVK